MLYVIVALATMTFISCGKKNTPIRFANYNMRVITAADTAERAFTQREPFILKRISDHDFDIIGAQEVNDQMKASLMENLAGTYSVVGEGRRADRKGEGAPIFYKTSRFELLDWGSFWLSETPEIPVSSTTAGLFPGPWLPISYWRRHVNFMMGFLYSSLETSTPALPLKR